MARLNLSVLALCFFLAVMASALPAVQDKRAGPADWAFHMVDEMGDSTNASPGEVVTPSSSLTPTPTPTPAPSHARMHAPVSSASSTPSAHPTPSPSKSSTPSSSSAAPKETVSGGKDKSAIDDIPVVGPLLAPLLGGR